MKSGIGDHGDDVRFYVSKDLQSLAYLAEAAVIATSVPSAAAVRLLRPGTWTVNPWNRDYGLPAISLSGCRQYARHVVATCGLAVGRVPITGGRGRRSYYGTVSVFGQEIREIRIVTRHRLTVHECEWTILHELAHLIAGGTTRGESAGHGKRWRQHYCTLVGQVIGPDPARALGQAFLSRGL
jgi:putative metallohydrolase (TIGR04338 family)